MNKPNWHLPLNRKDPRITSSFPIDVTKQKLMTPYLQVLPGEMCQRTLKSLPGQASAPKDIATARASFTRLQIWGFALPNFASWTADSKVALEGRGNLVKCDSGEVYVRFQMGRFTNKLPKGSKQRDGVIPTRFKDCYRIRCSRIPHKAMR